MDWLLPGTKLRTSNRRISAIKIPLPQSSPGDHSLTKKPEDSGYQVDSSRKWTSNCNPHHFHYIFLSELHNIFNSYVLLFLSHLQLCIQETSRATRSNQNRSWELTAKPSLMFYVEPLSWSLYKIKTTFFCWQCCCQKGLRNVNTMKSTE